MNGSKFVCLLALIIALPACQKKDEDRNKETDITGQYFMRPKAYYSNIEGEAILLDPQAGTYSWLEHINGPLDKTAQLKDQYRSIQCSLVNSGRLYVANQKWRGRPAVNVFKRDTSRPKILAVKVYLKDQNYRSDWIFLPTDHPDYPVAERECQRLGRMYAWAAVPFKSWDKDELRLSTMFQDQNDPRLIFKRASITPNEIDLSERILSMLSPSYDSNGMSLKWDAASRVITWTTQAQSFTNGQEKMCRLQYSAVLEAVSLLSFKEHNSWLKIDTYLPSQKFRVSNFHQVGATDPSCAGILELMRNPRDFVLDLTPAGDGILLGRSDLTNGTYPILLLKNFKSPGSPVDFRKPVK